ncbi:MAG: leucine-rich repeat protein [Clostridia bacterium]|nr:leucine-rich repeat protein [Clostridia bacterium]
MKQRISKILMLLFTVACFSCLFFLNASAAEETVGDFVFTVSGSSATLKEYKGTASAVEIPSKVGKASVTAIGNEAFWSNKTMKSVSIPSTVKVIGTAAFNECTSLTKIVLPAKMTTLGNAAFWYCTSLKQVLIGSDATYIGENAFVGCHEELTVYVVKDTYAESAISGMKGVTLAYRYVTDLKLSSSSLKLTTGQTKALTYTYSPEKVYNSKVKYKSDNTSVVTVDSKGNIKAVAPGKATVTVTTADGSKISRKATVTVVPEKVSGFNLTDVTPTGYTLNWARSEGATKYKVYRYNSETKKYETYKYTTDTSLTVSGMKVGSNQLYKVLAYTSVNGTTYKASNSSAYRAYVAKPQRVEKITAKPAHNYINLSWQAPENTNGYRIYFYDKEASKYTFYKSTTKTSYKISGLSPDTEYTFMIKAYLKLGGAVAYASYSPLVSSTTRPDYIKGVTAEEGSVFSTSLTLSWDKYEKASGYQIRQYEPDGSYVTVATVEGNEATSYTVSELSPSTSYGFSVRAYVSYGGKNLYGYFGDAFYITTDSRPETDEEAFDAFAEAYGATVSGDESIVLVNTSDTYGFEGENSSEYEDVIAASHLEDDVMLYFTDGKEKTSGKQLYSFISDDGDGVFGLDFEDLSDIAFEDDGNGIRVCFSLNGEDDVTELFSYNPAEAIAQNNSEFALVSYTYGKAEVTAKINGGTIDDITVTVPVSLIFTLAGREYSFSQVYTTTYLFIR